MKKYSIIYIVLGMTLLMMSCDKELKGFGNDVEYEAVKFDLDVSETSITVDGSQQTYLLQITCNSYWTAQASTSWLSLDKRKGNGNGRLEIEIGVNKSTTEGRSGEITVTDGFKTIIVTVWQEASTAIIQLSESSLNFSYSGGNNSISVESNVDWTVSSDADWCTLYNIYSSSFRVSVGSNNSYSPRSAHITVSDTDHSASQTIEVYQQGAEEPTISQLTIYDITKTSAKCSFTYTSKDVYIKQRGICYSTNHEIPTMSDKTSYSSGTYYSGTATVSLTNLTQNTTYYVRPYVTTSIGTTYGEAKSFSTLRSNAPGEGDNITPGIP